MNSARLRGVAISVVTSVVCLAAVELLLRWLAPVPDPYEKLKYGRPKVNQYIASDVAPHYSVVTEVEDGLPGIRGQHRYTLNNRGFRGDDLTTPKPPDEFRIFMVGGSTTECFYLDDSESIERVVQKALAGHPTGGRRIKVYNAGRSGDATDDHISMIVHRIVHLEPDMIIVSAGINDLSRSIYKYDYLHYVTESPKGRLPLLAMLSTEFQLSRRVRLLMRRAVPTEQQTLEDITLKSSYGRQVALRKSVPESNNEPANETGMYQQNLKTIVGVAQIHGAQLILMTQQTTWNSATDPEAKNWHWMRYRDGITYREEVLDQAMESTNDVMRKVAANYSIPLYDLSKVLPKSLEYFYDDVHFNPKGAYTTGTGLASFIVETALNKNGRTNDLSFGRKANSQ